MNREELQYEERIRQLQENIASLRMSRRILMTLLEQSQNEYRKENQRFIQEKKRLQKSNSHYANLLWEKNKKIRELEKKLEG
ncbi:MAG: translation initiation factor 2 [Bacillota bacterium]